MSLPSQTARSSPAGRSFVYRRRRGRRNQGPLLLAAAAGVVVVLFVIGMFVFGPWGGGSDSASSTADAGGMVDPLLEGNGPVVIDQGAGLQSAGSSDGRSAERFAPAGVRDRDAERSQAAVIPEEDISIPDLVPPPVRERRGMLDEAMTSGEARPSSEPVRPIKDDPAPVVRNDGNPIAAHLEAATALLNRNDPLAARQALWDAMLMPELDELQLQIIRNRLTALNDDILFGPVLHRGDPLSRAYVVKSGDSLSRIASREDLQGTHWKLIQRINGLSAPEKIRVGQTLKLVPGVFHAVVDKSDFRLDLYHGPTEYPERWVFIRSFDVGLGEGDSTPIGQFIVRENGKLDNPGWVNPRNPAEKFSPNDPNNPIGDYWVGLDGLGDAAAYAGYGIHGTIDMDSVGQQRSMGCVRLRPNDIALVFEVLSEGKSLVKIRR